MSLSVQSPFLGQKRLLSDREDSPDRNSTSSPKRLRRFTASPSGRCSRRESGIVRAHSNLTQLKILFPHMDEKAVVEVLDSCGNNIDEAIKLLGALQLSQANERAQTGEPRGEDRAHTGSHATTSTQPHMPSLPKLPGREAQAEDGLSSREKAAEKAPAEWVEGLVQQMSGAMDMGDARTRAANELRSFEQAVMQTTNKARQEEISALQARVVELNKENALLKRAVTIQQSRLQEAGATNKQQASQAESAITELQGRIHALEMSNYSLSLHLRQATSAQSYTTSHPDIF